MSKKHHGGPAPVPPGNQRQTGPVSDSDYAAADAPDGAGFQEQDPKRRLGGFETAGEHSRQQPGALNDGGSASRKG
jgi:hypothetical protein